VWRLTTVRALQGGDEQQRHGDEKKNGHGSNYSLCQFVPQVAILTGCDKFLPY
jgi:hypothetical protein